MRSTGPKNSSGSMEISSSPHKAVRQGARVLVGPDCGDIASSGLTRIALQAGRKLAPSAAATEPSDPKRMPPQLGTTPAANTSEYMAASIEIHAHPSGT